MRTSTNPCLHEALPALLLGYGILGALPLTAEEPRVFEEERRITAIDLVLGFEIGAVRDWATESPIPKNLVPEDFEILYDSEPRGVVAVEPAAEPWEIVLYFDAELASSVDLRWAATILAERGDELTALGEVAVVVADPEPRTLLSATRDVETLNAVLAQVAADQEGQDQLVTLRGQALRELPGADPELVAEIPEALAGEEARIVRRRHDQLLLELTRRDIAGTRRALILAGGGYDLRPDEFYGSLVVPAAITRETRRDADPTAGPSPLAATTETLAQTLSAYGWITIPLMPPEPDPLVEGIRIGKWRLTGPSIGMEEQQEGYETYDRVVVKLFGATLESHRKPKRAEAYLELGVALLGQGKLDDAEDALRKAVYHFAGAPKTADRQAVTLVLLGELLDQQGKTQQATRALDLARRLDPKITEAQAGPVAGLLDPLEPLAVIARATTGKLVRGSGGLTNAFADLRLRVRLTYQVAGKPDGELHTLEARFRDGQRQLTHPAWARSSTPSSIAAARARRLLAGEPLASEPPGGELDFHAEIRDAHIHLEIEPPDALHTDQTPEPTLRLTLGYGGPETEPIVEHRPLGAQPGREEAWTYQLGIQPPEDLTWLAILVEDLNTGQWGTRLLELP